MLARCSQCIDLTVVVHLYKCGQPWMSGGSDQQSVAVPLLDIMVDGLHLLALETACNHGNDVALQAESLPIWYLLELLVAMLLLALLCELPSVLVTGTLAANL